MLLERISLEGICRVVNVSMPWLLNFIETTYNDVPEDLNVVINNDEITHYSDNLLDDKFKDLAKKMIEPKIDFYINLSDCEYEYDYQDITSENLNFDDTIENEIANQMEDAYTHEIVLDKNSIFIKNQILTKMKVALVT